MKSTTCLCLIYFVRLHSGLQNLKNCKHKWCINFLWNWFYIALVFSNEFLRSVLNVCWKTFYIERKHLKIGKKIFCLFFNLLSTLHTNISTTQGYSFTDQIQNFTNCFLSLCWSSGWYSESIVLIDSQILFCCYVLYLLFYGLVSDNEIRKYFYIVSREFLLGLLVGKDFKTTPTSNFCIWNWVNRRTGFKEETNVYGNGNNLQQK